jgi:hypothetical protein
MPKSFERRQAVLSCPPNLLLTHKPPAHVNPMLKRGPVPVPKPKPTTQEALTCNHPSDFHVLRRLHDCPRLFSANEVPLTPPLGPVILPTPVSTTSITLLKPPLSTHPPGIFARQVPRMRQFRHSCHLGIPTRSHHMGTELDDPLPLPLL